MITLEEFKARLLAEDCEEILQNVILHGPAAHVEQDDIEYLRRRLAETFSVALEEISLWVVGSAKLGFSISEKRRRDLPTLPRFRAFRPDSDIDLAILSPPIFAAIWSELSAFAYRQAPRMPWDSGKLGDYMVHGWLRPDHFPKGVRLMRCDQWWDFFRAISAESRFGRRTVRGALYNSLGDLSSYHLRGLRECRQALEQES